MADDFESKFGFLGSAESSERLSAVAERPLAGDLLDVERLDLERRGVDTKRNAPRGLSVAQEKSELSRADASVLGERVVLNDLHRSAHLVFALAGRTKIDRASDQMPAVAAALHLESQRVK